MALMAAVAVIRHLFLSLLSSLSVCEKEIGERKRKTRAVTMLARVTMAPGLSEN